MFLDALLSGQPKETLPSSDPEDRKKFLNNLLADLGSRQLTGDEAGEIAALGHLLGQANAYPLDNNKVGRIGKPDRPHLVENADVYVCWYSQLRELIDRKPELASDLRVCALPGRGFRGDWYIGILRGSVSPLLGQEVIEKLCRLDEEHKRFSRGVGLPVSKRFLAPGSNYFAWPIGGESQRSPAAVPLSRVFRIHGQAWLRSDIDQYKKIRSTLAAGAQQLAELSALASANEQEARDLVKKVVGARMFRQILMLSPELRERARALARPGERRAQEHEAGPALGAPDR
jgi:hypothetical protein